MARHPWQVIIPIHPRSKPAVLGDQPPHQKPTLYANNSEIIQKRHSPPSLGHLTCSPPAFSGCTSAGGTTSKPKCRPQHCYSSTTAAAEPSGAAVLTLPPCSLQGEELGQCLNRSLSPMTATGLGTEPRGGDAARAEQAWEREACCVCSMPIPLL